MQGCARCIGAGLHVLVPHPAAATALHLRLQGQLPRAPLPGQAQIRPQESHADLLPPPFRSAVVRSSRWRGRRPSGGHPSSKPSDNATSPSAASLRRPVPEILIACHPSSSAIRARSPRSVVLPEPRGPARHMRRPGAPDPSQIPSRKPSPTDALSLWKAGRRASVASSGTGPVFTMAHPSFGSRCPESAEFSRHRRKSPTAQSLQGIERVKQDQPGKLRRHHADACAILGHVGQTQMAYAGQFTHGKALQISDGICSPPSRSAGARPSCTQSHPKHPFRLQCLSPAIAR